MKQTKQKNKISLVIPIFIVLVVLTLLAGILSIFVPNKFRLQGPYFPENQNCSSNYNLSIDDLKEHFNQGYQAGSYASKKEGYQQGVKDYANYTSQVIEQTIRNNRDLIYVSDGYAFDFKLINVTKITQEKEQ